MCLRAIFNLVSKLIHNCFVFAYFPLRLVQRIRVTLSNNQRWKAKTNYGLVARIFLRFRQFTLSSYCFLNMFSSLLNGRGDYHGFGLRHSIKKRSNNDLGITVSDYGFHFSDNTS